MRSATTADNSDSIAPSMATVKAGTSNGPIISGWNSGNANAGRPLGMPPKRVPILSTGNFIATTATVHTTRAAIDPGMRLIHRRQRIIMVSAATATTVDAAEIVEA